MQKKSAREQERCGIYQIVLKKRSTYHMVSYACIRKFKKSVGIPLQTWWPTLHHIHPIVRN